MVKISNIEWKVTLILCAVLCSSVMLPCGIIFIEYDELVFGVIFIVFSPLIGLTVLVVGWTETVILDEEKIVVYRWGKEINRIIWNNVIEIYREYVKAPHRFNCYYYFSDGYDRFLDAKDGNEHFVVFRCPRKVEYLFSKFTKLPIKELERKN